MKLDAKTLIGAAIIAAAAGTVVSQVAKTPRERIVEKAYSQIGVQNPDKFWADVQPALVRSGKAWCGGFALWVLRQVGIARHLMWQIGKGFTAINGLPTTRNPLAGDIAYFDQPFQHHAIVVSTDNGVLKTIDGNQTGNTVLERERPMGSQTAFYSIEPLLRVA